VYSSLDLNKTKGSSRLERYPADAQGLLELSLLSCLLAGRRAGRVRVERQEGAALGRGDGRGAEDARGPVGPGQLSGLLAGR
jgi:hypothetical protein